MVFLFAVLKILLHLNTLEWSSLNLSVRGFIPCSNCATKSESELIKIITDNRFDPEPFPEQSGWDERDKFVDRLIKEGLPEKWKDLQPVLNELINNRKLAKNK